jgi:hypothetical protein
MPINMEILAEIQHWYLSQCDGTWEHAEGITIDTLDNPGWRVKISLKGTIWESKPFQEVVRLEPEVNWVRCWIEGNAFQGAGGPNQLEEIHRTFLEWIKAG